MKISTLTARFLFLATFSISLTLNSCGHSSPSQEKELNLKELHGQVTAKYAQIQSNQPPEVPPALIIISIDQSESMKTARVARVTLQDFQPVFESLTQTGGTLAVSLICSHSDRPLTRVTVDPVPQLTVKMPPNPPEPPNSSRGNPYNYQKKLEAYRKAAKEYQAGLSTTEQQLTAYEQDKKHQLEVNHQKIEKIKPEIQQILDQNRNCQATDIQNAIERANWFFNEPQPNNWQKPRQYALFITDGLDTFSQKKPEIQGYTGLTQ